MRHYYKILFAFVTSFLIDNQSIWADNILGIVVTKFEKVEFFDALSAIGRLEVDGDNLWVVSKDNERLMSFPIAVGLRVGVGNISDEIDGVRTLKGDKVSISYSQSSDMITIKGLEQPVTAQIFDMSGHRIVAVPVQVGGVQQINTNQFTPGVYILQIDNQVFKLIKK
jgi:hypothetical protein